MTEVNPSEIGALVRQVLGDSLGYLYPAALRVAVRLNVAEHLAEGPRTPAELAELTKADPAYLGRLLRYLATRKVFEQDIETGAFKLTPAASLLRADSPASVRTMVLLLTDEIYWKPAGRLEETVLNGTTIFDEIYGSPLFDYLEANEEKGDVFHTGIADLSVMEQGGIADSYDFPETGQLVDVAGGPGGFLDTVLKKNPGLTGVLVDQESVLKNHRLSAPEIAGRWSTAVGDFFTEVPKGGDIYILKRVLHDWDDESCLKILSTVRAAMSSEARLLVIDAVVPVGNDPHPGKLYDLAMMTNFNGKERTENEFNDLFAATGLKATQFVQTPGTVSVIEVLPV
ncbi:MAG: methyltransferase [Kibdelosporangium sp.]